MSEKGKQSVTGIFVEKKKKQLMMKWRKISMLTEHPRNLKMHFLILLSSLRDIYFFDVERVLGRLGLGLQ